MCTLGIHRHVYLLEEIYNARALLDRPRLYYLDEDLCINLYVMSSDHYTILSHAIMKFVLPCNTVR
jgi:hypothetical protein